MYYTSLHSPIISENPKRVSKTNDISQMGSRNLIHIQMANTIAPKANRRRPYAIVPAGWGREGEFDFLHGMRGSNRTAIARNYVRTNHQLNEHTTIPKRFQEKIKTDFKDDAEFITHQTVGDSSMRNFLFNLENQYRDMPWIQPDSQTNHQQSRR